MFTMIRNNPVAKRTLLMATGIFLACIVAIFV